MPLPSQLPVPSPTPSAAPSLPRGTSPAPPLGYRVAVPAASLPIDAIPEDVDPATGQILLSSYSTGLLEIQWAAGGAPALTQTWPKQTYGTFGEARYGAGVTYANIYSKGLAKIAGQTLSTIGTADGLISADLLAILPRAGGELWVAGVPTPVGGGGVQILRNDKPAGAITLASTTEQTLRRWIEMPERNSVFAATGAGVIELKSDGTVALLDGTLDAASAIARQPGGTAVGAAAGFLKRWDGQTFHPMGGTRPMPTGGQNTGPIDLVIEPDGTWVVLFADGFLSVLDSSGSYLGGFDTGSGIPASAQRLLLLPDGVRVLVGGTQGLIMLSR